MESESERLSALSTTAQALVGSCQSGSTSLTQFRHSPQAAPQREQHCRGKASLAGKWRPRCNEGLNPVPRHSKLPTSHTFPTLGLAPRRAGRTAGARLHLESWCSFVRTPIVVSRSKKFQKLFSAARHKFSAVTRKDRVASTFSSQGWRGRSDRETHTHIHTQNSANLPAAQTCFSHITRSFCVLYTI